MKAHFKHLCEEKQGDQKNFWSTIELHAHLRKNAYSGHTIVLIDKDQIIRDQLQVCETLNDFFTGRKPGGGGTPANFG